MMFDEYDLFNKENNKDLFNYPNEKIDIINTNINNQILVKSINKGNKTYNINRIINNNFNNQNTNYGSINFSLGDVFYISIFSKDKFEC